jgi:hypothetical protein
VQVRCVLRLDGKGRWGVRQIAQKIRMNGCVEKPRWKRTVGLLSTCLLALALKAGAPCGFIQRSGEVEL